MIDGTPVLDIKPYIPEYDSPITRKAVEFSDPNSEQSHGMTLSLDEKSDFSQLQKDTETDAPDTTTQRPGDVFMEGFCQRYKPEAEAQVFATESSQPLNHLNSMLKGVKAYVAQHNLPAKEQVAASPGTKPVELGLDPPCYGEETYSTIASWIREPPVSTLEVRFTPQAERQLARFLPNHPSSKENNTFNRLTLHSFPQKGAHVKQR